MGYKMIHYGIFVLISFQLLFSRKDHLTDLAKALSDLERMMESSEKYGVALMLRVAAFDEAHICDQIRVPRIPLHVTIAYLELPHRNAAERVGKSGRSFIEKQLALKKYSFCIDNCAVFFGHITVLSPTGETISTLKILNSQLEQYLLNEGFPLNAQTTNVNYTPHITLSKKPGEQSELLRINNAIESIKKNGGKPLCLGLDSVAVVVKALK